MAEFNNNITSVGNLYQAENMTFGAPASSAADLQRQIADLQRLLERTPDVPQQTREAAAQALEQARETPADEPGARDKIVGRLEGARRFLEAATGIAKQAAPLIGAIGAVIGAATGLAP